MSNQISKKKLVLVAASAVCLLFAGCGNNDTGEVAQQATKTEVEIADTTETEIEEEKELEPEVIETEVEEVITEPEIKEEDTTEEEQVEETKEPEKNEIKSNEGKTEEDYYVLTPEDFEILGEPSNFDYSKTKFWDMLMTCGELPNVKGKHYDNFIDAVDADHTYTWELLYKDNYTTARGIGIGSTLADIAEAYGTGGYINEGGYPAYNVDSLEADYGIEYLMDYTTKSGRNTTLRIMFNMTADDKVMSIHYESMYQ